MRRITRMAYAPPMIATREAPRYPTQRIEPAHPVVRPTGEPSVFEPGPDHWMLTVAVLGVTLCTAALPSPLMIAVAALALCALAPSETLPAMLAIGAMIAMCLALGAV